VWFELSITGAKNQILQIKTVIDRCWVTLEFIIGLDYQREADVLHTDPYVGKLIVETLHNLI
jgi:hypothetical protein